MVKCCIFHTVLQLTYSIHSLESDEICEDKKKKNSEYPRGSKVGSIILSRIYNMENPSRII
jgi:hypothetical protein